MCRLLAVKDDHPFAVRDQLRSFAEIARDSREYQGHGWGCVWQQGGAWRLYRNINPIWEDDVGRFGETHLLLAHARSAYRNEGLVVDNNMPFLCGRTAFIFNGELHGVRIREAGRIGAEKLFRFLLKVSNGDGHQGLRRAIEIVKGRARYIRAMNFVLAEARSFRVYSCFNENPEYFTMHVRRAGSRLSICSEPFPHEEGWEPLGNDVLEVFA